MWRTQWVLPMFAGLNCSRRDIADDDMISRLLPGCPREWRRVVHDWVWGGDGGGTGQSYVIILMMVVLIMTMTVMIIIWMMMILFILNKKNQNRRRGLTSHVVIGRVATLLLRLGEENWGNRGEGRDCSRSGGGIGGGGGKGMAREHMASVWVRASKGEQCWGGVERGCKSTWCGWGGERVPGKPEDCPDRFDTLGRKQMGGWMFKKYI